jgi:hypothetical protein
MNTVSDAGEILIIGPASAEPTPQPLAITLPVGVGRVFGCSFSRLGDLKA